MKVSPEVKQLAAETAAKLGVATLYVNDKNEFFTEENLARGSVDSSTKIAKLTFEAEVEEEAVAEAAIHEETVVVPKKNLPPAPTGKYAGLLIDALQALCKDRSIPFTANAKEANLIGKLEAWDKAQEEAAADPEVDFVITDKYFDENKAALEADGKKVGDTIKLKTSLVPTEA